LTGLKSPNVRAALFSLPEANAEKEFAANRGNKRNKVNEDETGS
jgi:hypothetical protein